MSVYVKITGDYKRSPLNSDFLGTCEDERVYSPGREVTNGETLQLQHGECPLPWRLTTKDARGIILGPRPALQEGPPYGERQAGPSSCILCELQASLGVQAAGVQKGQAPLQASLPELSSFY